MTLQLYDLNCLYALCSFLKHEKNVLKTALKTIVKYTFLATKKNSCHGL